MNAQVLVLSSSYQPIASVSWTDAITMIFGGRAEVVVYYDDKVIRSASDEWKVPSVVRFLSDRSARFFARSVRFTRKNVWLRDGGYCQYCAKAVAVADFTYDHVTPRSRGGKTVWENIVVSCVPCNQQKGNRTPTEVRMNLKSRPVKPKSLPSEKKSSTVRVSGDVHPSWRSFLISDVYWNSELEP